MDTPKVRLSDMFPSDAWINMHIKAKNQPIWFRILVITFMDNMALYVSPMGFMSDVGLAKNLESGKLRRSFNPIRYLIGFPAFFSYVYALRRGVPNDEIRDDMWRHTMSPAITAINRVESGIYHEPRVCLVANGRLNQYLFGKDNPHQPSQLWDVDADRELVLELRAFITDDYHIADDDWWKYVIEGDDIFMELIPGRKHPYKLMSEQFRREHPDWKKAEVMPR